VNARSFEDLVSLYFDEALDAQGLAELNRMLAQPELAQRFVQLSRVHGGMRELSSLAAPQSHRRLLKPWLPPAVAAAGFLILIYFLSGPAARLEEAVGQVKFDGKRFESRASGSGTIVLPDGTRLLAGAETTLRLDGERIQLDRGRVAADVGRERGGRSLVFSTPQAEAKGLDAKVFLSVDADSTVCSVEKGQVELTQKSTHQKVHVDVGQFAVAGRQGDLKAEPVAQPAQPDGAAAVRVTVAPRWPKTFKVTTFTRESLIYGDRGWRITEIPKEVDGAQGIKTFAEERSSQEEGALVFEIDREADVWVGIDGRAREAKKLPLFLASWDPTGLKIHSKTAGNTYYHLYRRRFPAGIVTLGGNHHGGDTGALLNYTVLITPPGR
jgi:ferric-dicitrate binding protein FerR (iron transport regulator)